MSTNLIAQNINLKVLDSTTKASIVDVQIIGLSTDSLELFTIFTEVDDTGISSIPNASLYYLTHINYEPLILQHKELIDNLQLINSDSRRYSQVLLNPIGNNLDEVTISALKFSDTQGKISLNVNTLNSLKISKISSQTSIDLIERTENVYVQKSQMGGGSPVLRGFEANKIVLSLDGVKMNNAIYRGGHLQNALSIGNLFIENLEVITGPGSIVYGSDALGGVISFQTPELKGNIDKLKVSFVSGFPNTGINGGLVYQKNNENINGFLIGINASSFYNYSIGKWRPKNKILWGNLPKYIETKNGVDTIVNNEQLNSFPNRYTSYQQYDFLTKYAINSIARKLKIEFIYNGSYAFNIPRFDRLNDISNGELKFAEWKYGKQFRSFFAVKFHSKKPKKIYTEYKSSIAYQQITESRVKRKFNDYLETNQIEKVNIFSFNNDFIFRKPDKKYDIQYGTEWILNLVNSTAFDNNISDDSAPKAPSITRYPDGGNLTQSIDAYGFMSLQLLDDLDVNFGGRLTAYQLKIKYNVEPFEYLEQKSTSFNWGATYSLGFKYRLTHTTRFKGNISSGFRAPNIDDIGKIFDPAPQVLVVPNTNVLPEYVYNFDLTWQQKITHFSNINIGAYFTRARNLIRRATTSLEGLDSISYENETFALYNNINVGKANLAGCFATVKFFDKSGRFQSNHNIHYTYGRDLSEAVPLGHIPPLYGKSEVFYRYKNWETQLWCFWNTAKKLKHYSPFSEDKLEEALPNGTPAWAVLNFQLSKSFIVKKAKYNIAASIENIMDLHYKPFSSGIAASGRNFKLKVSATF